MAPSRTPLFGSLLGMVFLVNLARVAFAPLLEPIGATFTVDQATLGLLATTAWLGSALPRIPTGYLLTRVARERVVLGSGLILSGAAVWTALASDVATLLVGAFLLGLSSGTYFVAANPFVSELFPAHVGTALGVHGTAAQVGAVAAAPLVLVATGVGTWRTLLGGLAVVAAVSTLVVFVMARRTTLPTAGRTDRDLVAALRCHWPLVLTAVVLVGCLGLVWNGLFNFYVQYLTSVGLGAGQANVLLTVAFTAGIPAFVVTGWATDRVGALPIALVVGATFAVAVLLVTVVRGFLPLAAISVVLGASFYSVLPAADAYLLGSLPDHYRASAYSVYSGVMTLVQALGAVTVGTLVEVGFDYGIVFSTFASALLVLLAAAAVTYRAGRLPTVGAVGTAVEE